MNPTPDPQSNLNEWIVSELRYIRKRVDEIYDRHGMLYARVIGISATISTVAVLLGWILG